MVSPSNTTDTTNSTDANIGSNSAYPGSTDATTGFTQINSGSSDADTSSTEVTAISTGADSVSTGINMGSTETGAGSTTINTGPTAANTSSTEANTESTVSEISSTQATTTVSTTTVNPVLGLTEILNTSSTVCIRNAQAGYLFTNASTRDSDRRYVYVSNESTPALIPESRWTLEPAQDGSNNHIYIKNSRNEYWYTSIYEKNTFNKANQNSFVPCSSENNVPTINICNNYARMTFTYIPGTKDSDEIFEIIPASNNRFKIRNTRYNRFQYASDGDVTSVVAGADAPDENLLWTFERCDF